MKTTCYKVGFSNAAGEGDLMKQPFHTLTLGSAEMVSLIFDFREDPRNPNQWGRQATRFFRGIRKSLRLGQNDLDPAGSPNASLNWSFKPIVFFQFNRSINFCRVFFGGDKIQESEIACFPFGVSPLFFCSVRPKAPRSLGAEVDRCAAPPGWGVPEFPFFGPTKGASFTGKK